MYSDNIRKFCANPNSEILETLSTETVCLFWDVSIFIASRHSRGLKPVLGNVPLAIKIRDLIFDRKPRYHCTYSNPDEALQAKLGRAKRKGKRRKGPRRKADRLPTEILDFDISEPSLVAYVGRGEVSGLPGHLTIGWRNVPGHNGIKYIHYPYENFLTTTTLARDADDVYRQLLEEYRRGDKGVAPLAFRLVRGHHLDPGGHDPYNWRAQEIDRLGVAFGEAEVEDWAGGGGGAIGFVMASKRPLFGGRAARVYRLVLDPGQEWKLTALASEHFGGEDAQRLARQIALRMVKNRDWKPGPRIGIPAHHHTEELSEDDIVVLAPGVTGVKGLGVGELGVIVEGSQVGGNYDIKNIDTGKHTGWIKRDKIMIADVKVDLKEVKKRWKELAKSEKIDQETQHFGYSTILAPKKANRRPKYYMSIEDARAKYTRLNYMQEGECAPRNLQSVFPDWAAVIAFANACPALAVDQGRGRYYRVLRAAMDERAPIEVIEAIIQAHPKAVQHVEEGDGMLPLHYALYNSVEPVVIDAILRAYPEAAERRVQSSKLGRVRGSTGLPIHLVGLADPYDSIYLQSFSRDGPFGKTENKERNEIDVVKALITAYPDSIFQLDTQGRTPRDIAMLANKDGASSMKIALDEFAQELPPEEKLKFENNKIKGELIQLIMDYKDEKQKLHIGRHHYQRPRGPRLVTSLRQRTIPELKRMIENEKKIASAR